MKFPIAMRFSIVLSTSLMATFVGAYPAHSSPVHKVAGSVQKVGGWFKGAASYYADKFRGHKTASGEKYDSEAFTCAHRTLPFGTKLLVQNPENGTVCTVTVNDRGPFHKGRIIDLSKAAAKKLGINGVGKVVCYTGRNMKRLLAPPSAPKNEIASSDKPVLSADLNKTKLDATAKPL